MMVSSRLRRFGTSIFSEVTALAAERGAINLGQGYPDEDGPKFILEAAAKAIERGPNQYAPMAGLPVLRQAIARRFEATQGVVVDWNDEVTVTSGCTGAITATMLGVLEPHDEVVLFEPWYDSYPASVEMAGGVPRYVRLEPPSFRIVEEKLRAAVTPRTRMIVLNTPHNPTGRVFDERELDLIETVAVEHDLLVLSDEVYEELTYGERHRSLLRRDGLRERTIVASSIGKSFSLTGWKIGWTIASPALTAAVRAAHQFMTFSIATPLQEAAAVALGANASYFEEFRSEYFGKRAMLVEGLSAAGLEVIVPEGTYFALADHTGVSEGDDRAFCRRLLDEAGVAAIPMSAFHHDGREPGGGGQNHVRFAFCKSYQVLQDAVDRISRMASKPRK
jgi:aspartate/methionine/tyrosine aminotransferase